MLSRELKKELVGKNKTMKALKPLILSVLLSVTQQLMAQTSTLPNGTKIPVKFSARVTSDDKIEPQVVVATDILDMDGNVLISAGSFVKVYCTKTQSEHNGNNGGQITVTFNYTQAVDGKTIDLSGGYEARGKANIAGNFITMNGKKLRGKPAVIEANTACNDVITKRAYEIKVQRKATTENQVVSNKTNTAVSLNTTNFSKYQKEYFEYYAGIKLNTNYTFKLVAYGQDYPFRTVEGKYSIEKGSIIFQANRCYLDYEGEMPNKNVNCSELSGSTFFGEIVQDDISPFYSEYLKLRFTFADVPFAELYGVPNTTPVNQIRMLNNEKIYVLGELEATTTSNTNMRQTPSANGKLVERYNWETPLGESSSKIPAYEKIIIIGRTPEKSKVGSWEDYWYVVELEEALPDDKDYVWVFGQNITFNQGTTSVPKTTTNKTSTTTPKPTSTTTPKTNTTPTKTATPSPTPVRPTSPLKQQPVPAKSATPYK